MRLHPFHGVLAVAASLLCAAPAPALIVHEGKIVPAWPDQRILRAQAPGTSAPIGLYPDPKGIVYGLTILVDFSDVSPAFSVDEVKSWLLDPGFSAGGVNGSIRDYFLDQSNGKVDFRNDVVGFVRAKQTKAYYESGAGYSRAAELVAELMAAVDGMVDFKKYDNDKNGSTEAISIVYAGPQETFGQGLWPHAGGLGESRDGVRLSRYQMSQLGTRLGLYTFAHEVGHMLFGWPDLYGFGNYCIMGNASSATNPVGINDVYRADQGWIPIIDITASMNGRFRAVPNAGGYRYVNPEDPSEWFFWYNQQNTGRWSSLQGSGLLVMHFDHSLGRNDPPNPLSLAVVQADGLRELDKTQWPSPGSDRDDFYRAGGNAELAQSTSPAANWNDGTPSGLRLYEVSESGAMMTFAVGTGTPGPDIGGASAVGGMGGMTGGSAGANTAGMSQGGVAGMSGTNGGAGPGGQAATAGTNAGGSAGTAMGGASLGGMAPASGAGGGAAAAAGSPLTPDSGDDGGCSCRTARSTGGPGGALALIGLALATALRRRRPAPPSSA